MALTVVVRSGDPPTSASITFDAPRIVIGRGAGCEVRLPDPSVSHRHASIRQRGTDYVVIDEGSTNGTFVGPVRLSPQAPRMVKNGDLIRVGRIWLELRIEQRVATQSPQLMTAEIALGLVANSLRSEGANAAPRVSVAFGPDVTKEFVLSDFERVYVIGRGPSADLALDDPDASRRHVEVVRKGPHVYVRDLGSKNGAKLGGKLLEPKRDTVWQVGLRLGIGASEIELEDPVLAALSEIEACSDERMRPEDEIEPPASRDPKTATSGAEGAPIPAAGPSANAPIAALPRSAPQKKAKKSGFRGVDVLIACVALAVIGLSLLGIAWLFRAD